MGSLVITILFALVSISLNLLLLLVLRKNSGLSKNTYILMVCFTIQMGSYSIVEVVRNTFLWHEFSWDEIQSVLGIRSNLCLFVGTYETISGLFQSFVILAVAIERAYAMLRYSTYDEDSKGFSIATIPALLFFHCALGINYFINASDACFGIVEGKNGQENTIGILVVNSTIPILIALEPVIIVCFAWIRWKSRLLLKNFFFNQAQITLTQRVHLEHILKGSKILLSVSVAHSIVYTLGLFFYEIGIVLKDTIFMRCYYAPVRLFLMVGMGNYNGIAVPLIFYICDKKIQKHVNGLLRFMRSNKINVATENLEANQRIINLENQWNKAFVVRHK